MAGRSGLLEIFAAAVQLGVMGYLTIFLTAEVFETLLVSVVSRELFMKRRARVEVNYYSHPKGAGDRHGGFEVPPSSPAWSSKRSTVSTCFFGATYWSAAEA